MRISAINSVANSYYVKNNFKQKNTEQTNSVNNPQMRNRIAFKGYREVMHSANWRELTDINKADKLFSRLINSLEADKLVTKDMVPINLKQNIFKVFDEQLTKYPGVDTYCNYRDFSINVKEPADNCNLRHLLLISTLKKDNYTKIEFSYKSDELEHVHIAFAHTKYPAPYDKNLNVTIFHDNWDNEKDFGVSVDFWNNTGKLEKVYGLYSRGVLCYNEDGSPNRFRTWLGNLNCVVHEPY